MFESALIIIASLISIVAPVFFLFFLIFLYQINKSRSEGFYFLIPYILLFAASLDIFNSGRQLDNEDLLLTTEFSRDYLSSLSIKASSVLVLTISLERIVSFIFNYTQNKGGSDKVLMVAYILFWSGAVLTPATISMHHDFHHEYIYTLLIVLSLITLSNVELSKTIVAFRNALNIFILLSFFIIFINPGMALQFNYVIGFIPGLPRMGGLAPHQTVFGALAFISILMNIELPLKKQSMKVFFILLAFVGLFLAQSKAVWVSGFMIFTFYCYVSYRIKLKNSIKTKFDLALIMTAAFFMCLSFLMILMVAFKVPEKIVAFLNSSEGAKITSVTGRDVIWEIALENWHKYPILGYGNEFLNLTHRISVGYPNATHAHNQFLDLLARSGLVGFITFTLLLYVLLTYILRTKLKYISLSAALFILLFFRCFSEVPATQFGYGCDFLIFLITINVIVLSKRLSSSEFINTSLMNIRSQK